jgi:hypothetical protein
MWNHEEFIETSASSSRVWELFSDVVRWKDWNAGIDAIEIHGPFAVGTSFSMRSPGQDVLTSTLVEVKPFEGFTDETLVGDTRVLVKHKLVQVSEGKTRIIYSTEITGPGAHEIGPMVTADFRDVLASLKMRAEQM